MRGSLFVHLKVTVMELLWEQRKYNLIFMRDFFVLSFLHVEAKDTRKIVESETRDCRKHDNFPEEIMGNVKSWSLQRTANVVGNEIV